MPASFSTSAPAAKICCDRKLEIAVFSAPTARSRAHPSKSSAAAATNKRALDPMISFELQELESAAALVYRVMPPTPVHAWPKLSTRLGCELFVKHENHTPTGAFKVRGG